MAWEQRGRIPSATTTPPLAYVNAVLAAKFFNDRMRSPRDVDAAILMTQGGRTGEDHLDAFHGVILSIQREEKCSFNRAAILAEERDPAAYREYVLRNTRGSAQFLARQASLRGSGEPVPSAVTQSATMQKILGLRARHMSAAKAAGKDMTIQQADLLTFSEYPSLYVSYLRENTRGSAIRQLGPVGAPEPKVNKDGAATWRSILLLDADGNAVTDMQKRIAMLAPFFAGLIGFEVASAAPPITGLPRNPGNTFWAEFHDAAAVKGLLPFPDPGEVTK